MGLVELKIEGHVKWADRHTVGDNGGFQGNHALLTRFESMFDLFLDDQFVALQPITNRL